MLRMTRILGAVLGTVIMLGSAGAVFADCRDRVERAEYRLDRAVARHGAWSHEAQDRRYELQRARDECRWR